MITQAITISLICFGVKYATSDGQIFGFVRWWVKYVFTFFVGVLFSSKESKIWCDIEEVKEDIEVYKQNNPDWILADRMNIDALEGEEKEIKRKLIFFSSLLSALNNDLQKEENRISSKVDLLMKPLFVCTYCMASFWTIAYLLSYNVNPFQIDTLWLMACTLGFNVLAGHTMEGIEAVRDYYVRLRRLQG